MEYIIIVTINQRRKINKEFYQGKKKIVVNTEKS